MSLFSSVRLLHKSSFCHLSLHIICVVRRGICTLLLASQRCDCNNPACLQQRSALPQAVNSRTQIVCHAGMRFRAEGRVIHCTTGCMGNFACLHYYHIDVIPVWYSTGIRVSGHRLCEGFLMKYKCIWFDLTVLAEMVVPLTSVQFGWDGWFFWPHSAGWDGWFLWTSVQFGWDGWFLWPHSAVWLRWVVLPQVALGDDHTSYRNLTCMDAHTCTVFAEQGPLQHPAGGEVDLHHFTELPLWQQGAPGHTGDEPSPAQVPRLLRQLLLLARSPPGSAGRGTWGGNTDAAQLLQGMGKGSVWWWAPCLHLYFYHYLQFALCSLLRMSCMINVACVHQ